MGDQDREQTSNPNYVTYHEPSGQMIVQSYRTVNHLPIKRAEQVLHQVQFKSTNEEHKLRKVCYPGVVSPDVLTHSEVSHEWNVNQLATRYQLELSHTGGESIKSESILLRHDDFLRWNESVRGAMPVMRATSLSSCSMPLLKHTRLLTIDLTSSPPLQSHVYRQPNLSQQSSNRNNGQ